MGKVLTCEKDSLNGQIHTFEIHKTSGSDSGNTFCMTGNYPTIRHQGKREIYNPIIPSTLDFTMRVDDSIIEGFIDDLIDSTTGEYYLKYYNSGILWYVGTILTDQITINDADQPWDFNVTTTDALGLLDKYPFTDADNGYLPFINLPNRLLWTIRNALKRTGFEDYYTASDDYIATSVNWKETAAPSGDPLYNIFVQNSAFYGEISDAILETEDSDIEYWRAASKVDTCREVVEKILNVFNARIYQQKGVYHITQVQEMEQTSRIKYYYYIAGGGALTQRLQTTEGPTLTEDKTIAHFIRRPGGTFQFLDPIGYALVKHNLENSQNLLRAVKFKDVTTPDGSERVQMEDLLEDVAHVDNSGNAIMKFSANIQHNAIRLDSGADEWPVHYILLRFTLKVGSYYFVRHRTVLNDADEWEFTEGEWTTDVGYCEIITTKNKEPEIFAGFTAKEWYNTLAEFETPVIPESGSLDVQMTDYALLSNTKPRRQQYFAESGPTYNVSLFTIYPLPWQTPPLEEDIWDAEDVNKIIKVYIEGKDVVGGSEALEYVTDITGDQQFTISGNTITIYRTLDFGQYVRVDYLDHGRPLGSPYTDESKYRANWETLQINLQVHSEDPERNITDNDFFGYIGENDLGDRGFVETEVLLGDNPFSETKYKLLWFDVGTADYVGTDLWQNRGSGPTVPVLQLKAEDIAATRADRLRLVNGAFTMFDGGLSFVPETVIVYEDIRYVLMSGTHDIIRDTVSGTWFQYGKDTSKTTTKNSGLIKVSGDQKVFRPDNDKVIIDYHRNITRTTDKLTKGLISEIPITEPYTDVLRAGDKISIQHPNTQQVQYLTVLEDVAEDDTTITVNEHLDYEYEAGALINLVAKDVAVQWTERITGVTGTTLTVSAGTLPNELILDEEEVSEKIAVYRNGVQQWYKETPANYDEFSIASQDDTITLQFASEAVDKWKIVVR